MGGASHQLKPRCHVSLLKEGELPLRASPFEEGKRGRG